MTGESNGLESQYWSLLRERGLAAKFRDIPKTVEGVSRPVADPDYNDQFWRDFGNRPYASFDEVSRERRTTLLARMSSVRAQPQPFAGVRLPQLQELLDRHSANLDDLVRRLEGEPPHVFCGLYPTGSLNAEARPADGGTLVLVNSGLMDLLYSVAKINVASSRLGDEPPLVDERQTAVALADVLNAYVFGANAALARALPPLEGRRRILAEDIAQTCEHFVLAHEYAHVLAGHFDDPHNLVSVTTPIGRLDVLAKSREQEFEADRMGVEILASALFGPGSSDAAQSRSIGAILFFFLADSVVRSVRIEAATQQSPEASDHPGSVERAERVASRLAEITTSRIAFDHITALSLWFEKHRPATLTLLGEVARLRPRRARTQRARRRP